jgi:hypothetical protein
MNLNPKLNWHNVNKQQLAIGGKKEEKKEEKRQEKKKKERLKCAVPRWEKKAS